MCARASYTQAGEQANPGPLKGEATAWPFQPFSQPCILTLLQGHQQVATRSCLLHHAKAIRGLMCLVLATIYLASVRLQIAALHVSPNGLALLACHPLSLALPSQHSSLDSSLCLSQP